MAPQSFRLADIEATLSESDPAPSGFNLADIEATLQTDDMPVVRGAFTPRRIQPMPSHTGVKPPLVPLAKPRRDPLPMPEPLGVVPLTKPPESQMPTGAPGPAIFGTPVSEIPPALPGAELALSLLDQVTGWVGGAMSEASRHFTAPATAIGEQVFGSLPGHEDEPSSIAGRTEAHNIKALSPPADPRDLTATAFVGNPPNTVQTFDPAEQAWRAQMGLGTEDTRPRGQVEQTIMETARRGLGTALQMVTDPTMVGLAAIPGALQTAVAGLFSMDGIKQAVTLARNPNATPADVAEGVVNAVLQTAPLAAHGLSLAKSRGVPEPLTAPIAEPGIRSERPIPQANIGQEPPISAKPADVVTSQAQPGTAVTPIAPESVAPIPEPPPTDILPTGEAQPRLPGETGAVRETERPTPQMEAPFSLTREAAQPEAAQPTLGGLEEKPTFAGTPEPVAAPTTEPTAVPAKSPKPSEMLRDYVERTWGKTFKQQDLIDAVLKSTAKKAKNLGDQKRLVQEWMDKSDRDIAAHMATRAAEDAPKPKTYVSGDQAVYTGVVQQLHGGTFYEVKILEGRFKGQVKVVKQPPKTEPAPVIAEPPATMTKPPLMPKGATSSSESFTRAMPTLARAKAESALDRSVMNRGRAISRRSLVEEKIQQGATVEVSKSGERRLTTSDGAYLAESQISKTAMDYAAHLLSRKVKPPLAPKPKRIGRDTLTTKDVQELRRIVEEMETMPFQKHTFVEGGPGRGGSLDIIPGSAGAPVFGDIALPGKYGSQGTRSEVVRAIKRFLNDGQATAMSDRAVDVARRRQAGDKTLSEPVLPPDAGFTREEMDAARMDRVMEDVPSHGEANDEPGSLGMSKRPTAPPKPALGFALKQEAQLRPSEIVSMLSKHLDHLPVRTRGFKQRALGIYKVKEEVVRLKVANDLQVLAHEVGHHVDHTLIGFRSPQVNAELLKLGEPTSKPSYTKKMKLKEGAAEFLRLYLSDPPAVEKSAPNYLASFEKALETQPALAAILAKTRRQYMGHLALDPVDRVLSHVDFTGDEPKSGGSLSTRLQTQWVDDLTPIRKATEAMGPVADEANGYKLARRARGYSAKADGFLKFGVKDRDGSQISGSFEAAMKPVAKDLKHFTAYLLAQRSVELHGRNIQPGIDLKDAHAVIDQVKSPLFDDARKGVYAYEDGLLEYARRDGALSDAQVAAIRKLNKAHVPFQRVRDALEGAQQGGLANSLANRGLPVKKIKGSGRDIINPLESIVRNTHTMVDMVEKNRALRALVTQAQNTQGAGRFIEKIPEPQEMTRVNLQQAQKAIGDALADAGLEVSAVMGKDGPQLDVDGHVVDLDSVVKIFTPAQFVKGDKGIITVINDGKPEFFAVNDKALYDAITAIGPKHSDLVVNLFMRPARLLRAGATTTVSFAARNPLRDTFTAAVNSQYGFKPGWDTAKGLFEYLKKGEDYQQFLNSGAGSSAMVAMDRNRVREELQKLKLADRDHLLKRIVTGPVDLIRAVSEATENATRLGEFMRGVEKEGRTAEGYARAGLAARDVTIDFARGGSIAKEVNRYTAFFNAGVQGVARLGEVFQRDPIGMTTRATLAITIPSMALWYLNHDNPEYQERPGWEKNAYWHLPLGKDKGFALIPKPFELGNVFGNVTEAVLSYLLKQDSSVLARVFPDKDFAWDAGISVLPTALKPLMEAYTNHDIFRKRAIVSPFDLNLDKKLQYNRWTSELSKTVGPKLGLAPALLDHLIYGYTAGFGRGVVQGVDTGLNAVSSKTGPAKPAGGLARAPLIGGFYRDEAGADAESLSEFYTARDTLEGRIGSLRRYAGSGDKTSLAQRQRDLRTDYGDPEIAQKRFRAVSKELTDRRDDIEAIFKHATMTPDQKRIALNRTYERMINAARRALGKPALPTRVHE